jgi:predicted ATP-dependent serine protease
MDEPRRITDLWAYREKRINAGFFEVGIPSLCVVYGRPGAGKTTMMLKIGDSLAKEGLRVLYVNSEENLGSFSDKVKRFEIAGFEFVENFDDEYVPKYECFIVDSINKANMEVGDLINLVGCKKVVFGTLHITKEEKPSMSMSLLHISDVVVRVDGMRGYLEKNRYGELKFFEITT